MPLKNVYEIFPNKHQREDFNSKKKFIEEAIGRELSLEEKVVAYIRFYVPHYGRYSKKRPKGHGCKSISKRTGLSVWKVRMIAKTLVQPTASLQTVKSQFEI